MSLNATTDPTMCVICLDDIEDKPHKTSCDHSFHSDCWAEYAAFSMERGEEITCPLCQMPQVDQAVITPPAPVVAPVPTLRSRLIQLQKYFVIAVVIGLLCVGWVYFIIWLACTLPAKIAITCPI